MKLAALILIAAGSLWAQGPTPVQQVPSRLDGATQVATLATSATTLTITPNGSEFVYIFEIDVSNCVGASVVTAAAVTTITTTGLNGNPIWTLGSGVTAGLCTQAFSMVYPTGVKSNAAGAPVTFVLPTFATNQIVRINVTWRSAP